MAPSADLAVQELDGPRRRMHLVWRQDRDEREELRLLVDAARESSRAAARRDAA
jgi:hypothetical protein